MEYIAQLFHCFIHAYFFTFTLNTGLISFGAIILTEILVTLITPLAKKSMGKKDRVFP